MVDEPDAPDAAGTAGGDPADLADLPEQTRVRMGKRQRMIDRGLEPYPLNVERTHALGDIVAAYDPAALGPDHRTGDHVKLAARVVFLRDTGKLVFARLRAGDGTELQAMFSLADLGADALEQFKELVDIGDHIAVEGEVVTSRRGELSVQAASWQMAAKTLRPLPNEHRPLSDEARVRLRFVDMIVRPEARDIVRAKAAVLQALRRVLDERGFVEVETPVLQLTKAAPRPGRSTRT
jgi:lysyl-tRNA synthetase class 2